MSHRWASGRTSDELGRYSSERRTGCANERPSGSVRVAPGNRCPYRDQQLGLKDGRIYSCDMEPGEKFIRRILKVVFMILAFVVALVFDESSFRMGWLGVVIFIIGASMGALALYLLKDLRN